MNTKLIGNICKNYRLYAMKKTLKEMSEISGFKISTLSAFEHGRSSNVYIFIEYFKNIPNEYLLKFIKEVEGIE